MNWQNVATYKNPTLFGRCINKQIVSSEEEFEHLFTELKKFLFLASISPSRSLPMLSKRVDEIWHEFILLTKDYNSFCHGYLGSFLHHNPAAIGSNHSNSEEFFDLYRDRFGTIHEAWRRRDGSCSAECESTCTTVCESSGE